MKKILVSTALLAGVLSYAGGFRVSLQGVKQLAMAHTSAHAEDASVTFFNPAGMSFIPNKLSVVAGGFGASNKVTFQNLNTLQSTETDNPIGTPLYAAIAYKPIENLSIGLSVTTPFGSTIQWPDNWEGRELVQKLELKSFYFQPMVSVKLAPWLAFGASYIYARGKVDWDKAVTQFDGQVNINDDKATGHGYGFGFYFRPDPKLDVSIAYRSPVDMKAKNGTATFKFPSQSVYSQLRLNAAGQDGFTATLPLVEEYTIGLTYKVTPKWQVSADFNYHGWERYSRLTLDFDNAPIGNQPDPTVLVNSKNFKNSKTFRLGTQYAFTNMIYGRLGAYYDEAPYTTDHFIPETPSYDTYVITGGVGFKLKQFGIDIAGGYAMPQYRTVNNVSLGLSGQSKATAFYFGLGLSYNPF
ncbi:OmpP1/FadL family transporter [Chryseobacterium pennipullorum]|uniref:Aromatic hydrocarbon degradation protein n=1 Tax=Chryseobacterium pennipullorum TaxID=2258963 RepID=A0A3D9AP75_9FLAO|nr:outer membrane protein transport protein [Chryseobacterium pennipullorum]REC43130.1 aromatic hydrocarbon degradation protein [Chryseobacterium pennipullorum]